MVNRFFFSKNKIEQLSKNDNKQFSDYMDVLSAISRTTCSSLYVIDYEKQAFEFVSENPLFLCGHSAEEVKKMGFNFYINHVADEDLALIVKINHLTHDFFEQTPNEERTDYTISYDFHMKSDTNKRILLHHKLTPIILSESGKLWKAICAVSLSTERIAGNIKASKTGSTETLEFNLSKNQWKTVEKIKLSIREREILQLSIRGFTINEIADKNFVSPDTIKFHRKKMFSKMNVHNMSEAIFYAANNKLI